MKRILFVLFLCLTSVCVGAKSFTIGTFYNSYTKRTLKVNAVELFDELWGVEIQGTDHYNKNVLEIRIKMRDLDNWTSFLHDAKVDFDGYIFDYKKKNAKKQMEYEAAPTCSIGWDDEENNMYYISEDVKPQTNFMADRGDYLFILFGRALDRDNAAITPYELVFMSALEIEKVYNLIRPEYVKKKYAESHSK